MSRISKNNIPCQLNDISQFANEVIDYSSSYGSQTSISYSAVNILGRPSKFPQYGDFSETFSMKKFGPSEEKEFSPIDKPNIHFHDFVTIKFESFVKPKAVTIYETYNPGAVIRILCYCEILKKWHVLWESPPVMVEKVSREFSPPIKAIEAFSRILRIEFNHSFTEYYTAIDGVCLVGTKYDPPPKDVSPIKSYPESLIRKKLEDFNIKPQGEPSKSMEEFLKSDLTVFMGNISPDLSPQDTKPSEQNLKTTKSIIDLPYEILSKILSFLDLKSKFRFSEVCRTFQSITMDPLLYHEVNLKFYWHLADSFLMKSITKRCTLTQKLDMSCCGFNNQITSKDFEDFIKYNGKSLTSLRLNSAYFLRYSCLQAITIHCFLLSELSIQNYANMTAERNYHCLFYLSNLKTLNLSQSGINQPDLMNILKNNKNLENLNLSFPVHQINMDEISIVIHSFNKKMKSLNFWKSSTLSNLGLRALSKSFNLEELDMGWCFREDSNITESMRLLTQNCKNMKKLVLTAIRSINERDLENISNCSKLEQLDLTGIIGVTLETCLRLLERCSNMNLLDVSFCENIDDDAVEVIRRNFPSVCIKKSFVPEDD